jgi:CRP/FNR family transcriptional regulator, cyclic AMP receptor protein
VFSIGDLADKMYVVINGQVELIIHGKVTETVETGGLFGEMAMFEDLLRVTTALVKSDATLVSVDRRRFAFLEQQYPSLALRLLPIMADRLRRMNESL